MFHTRILAYTHFVEGIPFLLLHLVLFPNNVSSPNLAYVLPLTSCQSPLSLPPVHPSPLVSLNVSCVICIDPSLMRKSPSADSNVGKPGRLTVKSVCTNQAWCCVYKKHISVTAC